MLGSCREGDRGFSHGCGAATVESKSKAVTVMVVVSSKLLEASLHFPRYQQLRLERKAKSAPDSCFIVQLERLTVRVY